MQGPFFNIFKEVKTELAGKFNDEKHFQWQDHFSEFGRGVSMYRTHEAHKLVLKGMPDELRAELWLLYSGKNYNN